MFGASRASALDQAIPVKPIPENLVFLKDEKRKSPGAIVIGGGVTTAQVSAIVGANPQNPFYNNRQNYSVSDDLRITKGRHSLSMGMWLMRVQQTAFSSAQQNAGTVSYSYLRSFQNAENRIRSLSLTSKRLPASHLLTDPLACLGRRLRIGGQTQRVGLLLHALRNFRLLREGTNFLASQGNFVIHRETFGAPSQKLAPVT